MAKRVTRRKCIATIATAMLPQPLIAQQAPMPIIGILDSGAATTSKLLTGFWKSLQLSILRKTPRYIDNRLRQSGRASCQSRRREDSDRFCGQRKSNRDRAGHEPQSSWGECDRRDRHGGRARTQAFGIAARSGASDTCTWISSQSSEFKPRPTNQRCSHVRSESGRADKDHPGKHRARLWRCLC
jgi:hypothetical protein